MAQKNQTTKTVWKWSTAYKDDKSLECSKQEKRMCSLHFVFIKPFAPYSSQMSPENAHKLIRIYMGGLLLGVNTLYMLSCFLKQFALER